MGNPLDPSFHLPRAYTGELIGIEYLSGMMYLYIQFFVIYTSSKDIMILQQMNIWFDLDYPYIYKYLMFLNLFDILL